MPGPMIACIETGQYDCQAWFISLIPNMNLLSSLFIEVVSYIRGGDNVNYSQTMVVRLK